MASFQTKSACFDDVLHKIHDVSKEGVCCDILNDKYAQWADKYEQDVVGLGDYNGPTYVAEALAKVLTNKNAKIIDIAAGTGLVAERLRSLGFENMDAVDGSQAMLDKAKENNLYKEYFQIFVTDKQSDIPSDTYDAAVTCGSFVKSHMPPVALKEIIRLVKPGGVIIFPVGIDENRYGDIKEQIDSLVLALTEAGKIRRISETVLPNYVLIKPCCLYVYQVL